MDHQRRAAHRQYKFNMDGHHATVSGKGHAWMALINTKNSAHGFSVELSPCCWRNGCNSRICDTWWVLIAIKFGASDSRQWQTMTWQISEPAVACPMMMNHLTSWDKREKAPQLVSRIGIFSAVCPFVHSVRLTPWCYMYYIHMYSIVGLISTSWSCIYYGLNDNLTCPKNPSWSQTTCASSWSQ